MFKALRQKDNTPPIYANLLVEIADGILLVDVEEPGWLAYAEPILASATRIGLTLRNKWEPCVWLRVNGDARYFSKVFGRIDQDGHEQVRVACVESGGVRAWLHRDGVVEVGPEPDLRGEFERARK